MQISARRKLIATWFFLSLLAAGTCSLIWPAAHLGNEYLPVGNDSFYHARRILDTARDPSSFYEFDTKIHAPEGSLLTWPWGYDYFMGWIVRIGVQLGLASNPMAILVWIPTAAVFISMGSIVLISRRLGLSLWSTVLAGLCVALSPLTQYLHGVGFIDHHYAEYIFVLATLAAGLEWFSNLQNSKAAIVLGFTLGVAPAIHNALFILQLPILVALLAWWVQRIQIPEQAVSYFALGLLTSTIAILVPSEPFRSGMFEYFLLSWFQLYVAAGTVITAILLSRLPRSGPNFLILFSVAVILLGPLTYQISSAQSFLTGNLTRLYAISEMQSPVGLMALYGPMDVTNRYSWLLWLTPLTFILCLYRLWHERDSYTVVFWIYTVCGLPLLAMQFRLHYFGSFALYLPWLVVADRLANRTIVSRAKFMLGITLLVLLAYSAPIRHQLLGPMMPANDLSFVRLRPVLASLEKACKNDPGVVLADNDAGHYIRYFTECSVIANNFLLTPQHGEKVLLMDRLFSLSAEELPRQAPFVRYILVRPAMIDSPEDDKVQYMSFSPDSSQLVVDLLLTPHEKAAQPLPNSYQLLHEARLTRDKGDDLPYARLYRILKPTELLSTSPAP